MPLLPPQGLTDQQRTPQSQGTAKRAPSTPGSSSREDGAPYALIKVDLRGMPKIDTAQQTFKVDMDVKLDMFIPNLREEPFTFLGRALNAGDPKGAFDEPLELRNFPLNAQRLHVEYEFEIDKLSLGEDFKVARSIQLRDEWFLRETGLSKDDPCIIESARLWTVADELQRHSIHFFDVSTISVTTHDDEWALHHDALEIYGQGKVIEQVRYGKWSVRIVLIVKRRPLFYTLNIALAVWCIVLFAFISFQFGAAELGARLQVTLTMVLTLVVFKLSVSTAKYVPITSNMTLMDWFMIAAFVVVALVAQQNFLAFKLLTSVPW
ncbi:hypothetical protein FOA52_012062 [Chlamydomonas sp. UWO 241]|nr:hypothetical protein FOA52_012062 [Chlamydomonas sp. UWO 241]